MNTVQSRFRYNIAIRSVIIYLVLSVLWIVLSDLLLRQLPVSAELKGRIEVWKGLIFVVLSTLILYFFVESAINEQNNILDELRRAHALINKTFLSMADAICIVNATDRRILACNAAYTTILGYEKDEVVGNTTDIMHVSIESDNRFGEMITDAFRTSLMFRTEYPLKKKDGTIIETEITVTPITADKGFPDGVVNVIRDISERKRAEKELRVFREQLLALTTHLQSSIEEERSRISREIHDDIGQRMTALRMDLSLIEKSLKESSDPVIRDMTVNEIPEIQRMIDDGIQTMRKIIRDLRPEVLDTLGLIDGIRWQADEFQKRTGIQCSVKLPEQDPTFESKVSTTIFRILQEALTNVVRHARATEVHVILQHTNDLIALEVADNGKGISEIEKNKVESFGLLGIRERARSIGGSMAINGEQGKGTLLRISVPHQEQQATV